MPRIAVLVLLAQLGEQGDVDVARLTRLSACFGTEQPGGCYFRKALQNLTERGIDARSFHDSSILTRPYERGPC